MHEAEQNPVSQESAPRPRVPESQQETEPHRTSFREIVSRVKSRIDDALDAALQREDPDIRELSTAARTSRAIEMQAAAFYQGLIPKALKRPDRPYEAPRDRFTAPSHAEDIVNFLRSQREETSPEQFREAKREFLAYFATELMTPVTEHESEGLRSQLQSNTYHQENSPNIILENIQNVLPEDHPDINITYTDITVRSRETNASIDLNKLLPDTFHFAPSYMIQNEESRDETGKLIQKRKRIDLHEYPGVRHQEGSFYEAGSLGVVAYDDITKTGNMLTLLHEISHAWQSTYYEPYGRHPFEAAFAKATGELGFLSYMKRHESEYEPEAFEQIRQSTSDTLQSLGIGVDWDTFDDEAHVAEGDQLRLTSERGSYIIESRVFHDLIRDYTGRERDAWVHGLRVLRLLRKNGINLEPNLKTLADFKAVIDPCLGTYQTTLERMVETTKRGQRFSKGSEIEKPRE